MSDILSNLPLERMAGQKALVVGGAGFIGSTLARRLVDLGVNVTVVDNLCANCGANLFNLEGYLDKIQYLEGDVGDAGLADDAVRDQHFIFSLAGHTSHMDSMKDPFSDLSMNVIAKLSILEACRRINPRVRILYTSTRQIYGRPHYLPVRETHPLSPVDVNGINEISAEHYHSLYHRIHNLETTILRLTNVYGPRMRIKDARQNFMGWWFQRLLTGEEIRVYGDGQQLRDLLFVEDVVNALLAAALQPVSIGEVFNLGGPPISLLDLAKCMVEVHGGGSYQLVPFPKEQKSIDIGSYYGDYAKATRILGWTPMTSLAEGLSRTFEYFREHLDMYL